MTPEERDRVENIRDGQRHESDAEFLLGLLDRETGVTDLEARIVKTRKLKEVHTRFAKEIANLRTNIQQGEHAIQILLTGFRLLYYQAYGKHNAWAGMIYTCPKCKLVYAACGNWHAQPEVCPLCTATNARDAFNNWRLNHDPKNKFGKL